MTREEAVKLLKEYALRVKPFYEPQRTEYTQAINMAIEALTYQNLSKPNNTCEVDLISREDAMGAVQDHFNADGFKGYYDGQQMMDRINALPSAETDGWIPCSERLPNEDECGWYLVTVKGHELFVDVVPFNDKLWKGLPSNQEVLAWKPLPMPYREDSEVEK